MLHYRIQEGVQPFSMKAHIQKNGSAPESSTTFIVEHSRSRTHSRVMRSAKRGLYCHQTSSCVGVEARLLRAPAHPDGRNADPNMLEENEVAPVFTPRARAPVDPFKSTFHSVKLKVPQLGVM